MSDSKNRLHRVLLWFERRLSAADHWQAQAAEDMRQIREGVHDINNALTPMKVDLRDLSVASEVDLEEVKKLEVAVNELRKTVEQNHRELCERIARIAPATSEVRHVAAIEVPGAERERKDR